ncbi:uncharacterized protein LOC125536674 [Triticum urartu]|uniref:uncharacterized protein LOC125536674 n=1 Tax=Triticum urartu TaxID=4572 RepID=UPI002042D56E|nr:uncharacterized protein LOC125536674 [Triticum urartu]
MEAREDVSSRNGGVEAFLASCAVSGDDAYGAARAVLERLQAPATRAGARRHPSPPRRRPRRRAGGMLPRLQPPHPRRRPTSSRFVSRTRSSLPLHFWVEGQGRRPVCPQVVPWLFTVGCDER